MICVRTRWVAVVIGGAIALIVIALLYGGSIDTKVQILLKENVKTDSGYIATLCITNSGRSTIRLNAFCTLYWATELRVKTNEFYQHNVGYAILKPDHSVLVHVSAPDGADVWETSFTYQARPRRITRVLDRMGIDMYRDVNSFVGQFGPTITNSETSKVSGR